MAAASSFVSGLAGRYASALFELTEEAGVLDAVADDLDSLVAMMAESEDLGRLLRSPVLAREDQARAMAALAEKAEMHEITRRFLGLVAHNRRLFALAAMIDAFRALLAHHRGELTAEVAAAKELSPSQMKALAAGLARAMGREVKVALKVDDGLIGGLVVRLGSRMIDASIRTKLERLELAMKGVR